MQKDKSLGIPLPILAGACLLSFASWAPMYCVPSMEHILKEELLLTHAHIGLLYIAPTMMIVATAIPAGIIADRIGVRKAAGIGAIIMAIGAVLRGTATNPSSLLAFTFIYGVGLGWVFTNVPKFVSTWAHREKAGMVTGLLTAAMLSGNAVALAITMPIVFPITNTFQGVFFIWSVLPVAAAILWWILVKETPSSITRDEPVSGGNTQFRQVLGNKKLWFLAGVFVLNDFFFFTWGGWTPALMMLKGATANYAGLIASLTMWVGIPSALLMPMLAYKLGLRKPFIWAPAIAMAIAAWIAIKITLPLSWLPMALAGVAISSQSAVIIALPVEMMPKKQVGAASGLVFSITFLGGIIGAITSGRILDLTGSLDLAFLILAAVAIAQVGLAFKLPETGSKGSGRGDKSFS